MDVPVELLASIVGACGLIISSIVAVSNKKIKRSGQELAQAKREMGAKSMALNFTSFLHDWSSTHDEIVELLKTTQLDRFVLFQSWNGAVDQKWTTAILQIRLDGQDPISYINFELDEDYGRRLLECERRRMIVFTTNQLDECAVKKVCNAERVKHSCWGHIEKKIYDDGSAVHCYFSIATHKDEPIPQELQTRINLLRGRLLGVANSF